MENNIAITKSGITKIKYLMGNLPSEFNTIILKIYKEDNKSFASIDMKSPTGQLIYSSSAELTNEEISDFNSPFYARIPINKTTRLIFGGIFDYVIINETSIHAESNGSKVDYVLFTLDNREVVDIKHRNVDLFNDIMTRNGIEASYNIIDMDIEDIKKFIDFNSILQNDNIFYMMDSSTGNIVIKAVDDLDSKLEYKFNSMVNNLDIKATFDKSISDILGMAYRNKDAKISLLVSKYMASLTIETDNNCFVTYSIQSRS